MYSGMRITTNAMIRRYSTNLNKALGDLDSTRNTVTTNRNFNKVSEDPAAAMKSFKLRSNYARTEVQMDNTKDALAKLDEVTSNVLNCNSMGRTFIADSLLSYSGPNRAFSSRQAYMQEIDQLVESFLQQMNGKYNENFIFGGASTKELPFTKDINPVSGQEEIFYRGVPVNTNSYLTQADLERILSADKTATPPGLGLKDGVTATTPPLSDDSTSTSALTTIMNKSTSTSDPKTVTVKDLYDAITNDITFGTDTVSTDAQSKLLNNDIFKFSGLQVKTALSNLTLNNLPDNTGYDPFDNLATNPSLNSIYADIMAGTDPDLATDDSQTMSYDDLKTQIENYFTANGGDITVTVDKGTTTKFTIDADKLLGAIQNSPQWDSTLTEEQVKDMLTDAGLKDEVTPVGLPGDTSTTPLTDLVNKIMDDGTGKGTTKDKINCDELEKAIDALVTTGDITDSQKYQLKSLTEIGYQLKLATYFNEHSYRDIGFGMKETPEDVLISTSAFDTAVNGLKIFGYGVEPFDYIDEDGNKTTYELPNNIVALAQELSKTLAVDDIKDFDQTKHDAIINKMKQCYDDMSDNGLAALGTKCKFLETTHDQLTEASQILNEQISDLDFCDPAEAITNLMWAQYAYNATLKVGNTLLSNSFIDFMS